MNDLYIYEKILKIIRERQNTIRESLCVGPVGEFVAFKELRACLGELATLEQEIKDLLNKVNDDE